MALKSINMAFAFHRFKYNSRNKRSHITPFVSSYILDDTYRDIGH